MANTSKLDTPSIAFVKSWLTENGSLNEVPSRDLVKALFGIRGNEPSPVDITDGVVNAAGGDRFRLVITDKRLSGTLWKFTTDLGFGVDFQKQLNAEKNGYVFRIVMFSAEFGRRPLIEYSARKTIYFATDVRDLATADEPQTATESLTEPAKEVVDGNQHKQAGAPLSPATGNEIAEAAAAMAAKAESGTTVSPESQEGELVGVTDLDDDDDDNGEESLMTKDKVTAFFNSLIENLNASGTEITDDVLYSAFAMTFADYTLDIINLNTAQPSNEGTCKVCKISGGDLTDAIQFEITIPAAKASNPFAKVEMVYVNGDLKLRASNKLREAAIAHLADAVDEDGMIAVLKGTLESLNITDRVIKLDWDDATGTSLSIDVEVAEPQPEAESTPAYDSDEQLSFTMDDDIDVSDEMSAEIDKVIEAKGYPFADCEMAIAEVVTRYFPGDDVKFTVSHDVLTGTGRYSYNVTLFHPEPEAPAVEADEIAAEGTGTETPEKLEEAMNSDKAPAEVVVDPNYLDLSDRDTRDRVIQVLFPGIIDPAITHLLNFLKDYHEAEQTPSFIETKGTLPTETTIVYDNVTFAIVKMKDGRFWRIFAARTDFGLEDHSWLTTRHMPDRWYQLGHDISDTINFVNNNRGGAAWRRRNSNV